MYVYALLTVWCDNCSIIGLFVKALVNSTMTPNMTFTKTSQKFGQWADHRVNTVYGLGFSSEVELIKVRSMLLIFSYSCRRLSTWQMVVASCPTALGTLCSQLAFQLAWCCKHSAIMATELLQPLDLACGTLFRSSCAIRTMADITYALFG